MIPTPLSNPQWRDLLGDASMATTLASGQGTQPAFRNPSDAASL